MVPALYFLMPSRLGPLYARAVTTLFRLRGLAKAPDEIPGIVLHLDASSLSGYDDGDAVTEWPGASGTEHRGLAVAGHASPTLHENRSNRRPMVRFDGDTAMLSVADHDDLRFGQGGFTVFLVLQRGATSSNSSRIMTKGSGKETSTGYTLFEDGERLVGRIRDGQSSLSIASPLDLTIHTQVVAMVIDSSAGDLSDLAGGIDSSDDLTIGGYGTGDQNWDGYLGEVVVYRRALTQREHLSIRQHLTFKWAAWQVG